MKKNTPTKRLATTLIGILTICLVFILLMRLSLKNINTTIDVSGYGFYNLTDISQTVLDDLDSPISITVFNSRDALLEYETEILSNYEYSLHLVSLLERYNEHPNISLEYIDIRNKPSSPAEFTNMEDLVFSTNDIVIASKGQVEVLSYDDVFTKQPDYIVKTKDVIVGSRAEHLITNVILRVSKDKNTLVTMITGYGQPQIYALEKLLLESGFEISYVDLETEEISSESSLVVLSAPQWDLEESHLKKIEVFLDRNDNPSSLLYITSYAQPDASYFPKLNSFLKKWGIQINSSVVFENNSALQIDFPNLYKSKVHYTETESQFLIGNALREPVIFYATPLQIITPSKPKITVETLWETSPYSGIFPQNYTGGEWQVQENDYTGPYPALVLASFQQDNHTNYLSVLSSSSSLDEIVFDNPKYGNRKYIASLIDKIADSNSHVNIPEMKRKSRDFQISSSKIFVMGIIFTGVIPAIILLVGVIVLIRRRSL